MCVGGGGVEGVNDFCQIDKESKSKIYVFGGGGGAG